MYICTKEKGAFTLHAKHENLKRPKPSQGWRVHRRRITTHYRILLKTLLQQRQSDPFPHVRHVLLTEIKE